MQDIQGASTENQISYSAYCQLGGCRNSSLTKVLRYNGPNMHYWTYHHVGYGQAYWKQDIPLSDKLGKQETNK